MLIVMPLSASTPVTGSEGIGAFEPRRADLRFDAAYKPGDLVVESDLATRQPAACGMAASPTRAEDATYSSVRRAQRREPILVEPVAATVDADVKAGPAEGNSGSNPIDW
jgi:hypothetical protein